MMLTRRSFLSATAATAATASWRIWAAEEGLPAYYGDHLADVARKVNRLKKTCCDGFWFLTDLHVPSNRCVSGRLLARLTAETGMKKVLCGGDHVEAFGGKDSIDRTIADYQEKWVRTIERAGGEFFPAKGNHDFTIRKSMAVKEGFTYSGTRARDILMDTDAVRKRAVTNPDDPEACYYYVDEPAARLRYIVADSSDRIATDRTYWAVEYGIRDPQLTWLAEKALKGIPAGWTAVVMQHIPVAEIVSCEDKGLKAMVGWRWMLEAYQNRRKVTIDGKTFDFTKARGRILCDITGHEHAERQTCLDGLWHITEPCDAAYRDYINGSSPWSPNLPVKERGTVFEQTFDAVQIDKNRRMLHLTRVGGGGDRTIHLKGYSMRPGEMLGFKTMRIAGPVTWGTYDASRITHRPNPQNRYSHFYSYHSDVAGIASDGTVTAKKPGECIVVALNGVGNKELFPLTVKAS